MNSVVETSCRGGGGGGGGGRGKFVTLSRACTWHRESRSKVGLAPVVQLCQRFLRSTVSSTILIVFLKAIALHSFSLQSLLFEFFSWNTA